MKKILSLIVLSVFVGSALFAQDKVKKATSVEKAPLEVKGKAIIGGAEVAPKAAAEDVAPAADSKMTFDYLLMDYGTITQGSNGVRTFPFINDGSEPLVIATAKGSCGCTVPRYPKEPILPGEKAEIEVRYDTKRVGPFTKTVRMTHNGSTTPVVLTIKGKVEAEPEGIPVKEKSLITPQGN